MQSVTSGVLGAVNPGRVAVADASRQGAPWAEEIALPSRGPLALALWSGKVEVERGIKQRFWLSD